MFSKKLSSEQIYEAYDETRKNLNEEIFSTLKKRQSVDKDVNIHLWNLLYLQQCELESSRRTLDQFVQKLELKRIHGK